VKELPEWLQGKVTWTREEIIADIREAGYTKAQAIQHANRYEWMMGRDIGHVAPAVDGWKFLSPKFKGEKVAYLFARGNKYRLIDSRGRELTPAQLLAPTICHTSDLGWVGL
jgi:hypothetical protein